ncbi:MAG: ribosome assembly cofactor RimP [Candidatus Cryptobacteroides sp.]
MTDFEKEIIEKLSGPAQERGCFIVDVEVTADDDITVAIEAMDRDIVLEDCVALDGVFHSIWNQDERDYSLTVTSAGLDMPFRDPRQYLKALGTKVEVQLKGGRKLVATLEEANGEGIVLGYSAKEAVEGSKKKVTVQRHDRFTFDQVNSVRPHIEFE